VRVKAGQAASFTILGEPETRFDAVVRDVEPAPSELAEGDTISADKAIYYNGLLEVANKDRTLRIGMTAQVSIVLEAVDDALSVPVGAVTDGPDGPSVQVMVGAQPVARAVETGLNDKVQVQIVNGLSEGDHVVIGTGSGGTGSGGAGSGDAGASGGRRMGQPVGM
jgi:macrolide-specific efflux system membrane fusion protein